MGWGLLFGFFVLWCFGFGFGWGGGGGGGISTFPSPIVVSFVCSLRECVNNVISIFEENLY